MPLFQRTILRLNNRRVATYTQGNCPDGVHREYFYSVDHQGQLFMDDVRMRNSFSCFKDRKFLQFFFKRLRRNNTNRFTDDFPFVSLCGLERNFLRCEDSPLVYTRLLSDGQSLEICHCGDGLTTPFQPAWLFEWPQNGRLYYPAPMDLTAIGLVKSSLAEELSSNFIFEHSKPTAIMWNRQRIQLDNSKLKTLLDQRVNKPSV